MSLMKFADSDVLKSKLRTYKDPLPENEDGLEALFSYVIKGNLKSFSEKLRNARNNKGISQISMSEYLDVRQSTFSSWERGTNQPRVNTIKMLCEYYDIDPSELIDINPLNVKNDSSVPLVEKSAFLWQKFEPFLDYLKKYEPKENIPIPLSDDLSFAYKVEDMSMFGGDKPLVKNSIVLFSTSELKDLDHHKKEVVCRNKICLVSICGEEPLIRLIKYDNGVLSLIAVNSIHGKSYSFPDSNDFISYLEHDSDCIYNGAKTQSVAVEFFGIAKKVIMNL